ncbi:MAG TPA: amino acid racemase [Caulobacteraceae bacterium]|jgi:aspartate racemase
MSERRKVAGVIGGLGPAATLDFFDRVLKATPAERDQDHLRLIIDNNPWVPDRNAAIDGTGPSAGPALAETARALHRAGAEFLVMPCNAAHAFQAGIEAATPLPFISLIDETVKAALRAAPNAKRAGILGARGTLHAGLYTSAFAKHGVKTIDPEGKRLDRLMALIGAVKRNDLGEPVRAGMRALAAELEDLGADIIVAACTEVPIILAPGDTRTPLISSTDALVARTVSIASGAEPLPTKI